MADRGNNPAEENRLANHPLVEILAEMVKSALEWEANNKNASERDFGLNQDPTGIDYPSTDT